MITCLLLWSHVSLCVCVCACVRACVRVQGDDHMPLTLVTRPRRNQRRHHAPRAPCIARCIRRGLCMRDAWRVRYGLSARAYSCEGIYDSWRVPTL